MSRVWRRRSVVLVGLFVLGLATPSSAEDRGGKPATAAAPAQRQDLVAKGRQLFDDQQYEESVQTLSAALLRPSNTAEQKVEIYRLLALDYITLGRRDEADNAIRGLLVVAPDYQLPPNESPRFRDAFKEARAKWEAEGRPGFVAEKAPDKPVVLRHVSPASAERAHPIDLHARIEDPGSRVASVRLYFRAGTSGDFTMEDASIEGGQVNVRIPASAVTATVVDYYLEVTDSSGDVLLARGDAQAPLRIAVPDGGSSIVVPLVIGGGVLGAAAIVGVLALAGVFKSSSPSAPTQKNSTVTVNVGQSAIRF